MKRWEEEDEEEAVPTVEGQVAEQSSQEVHGVHDQNGDVGHLLHPFLGGAVNRDRSELAVLLCSAVVFTREVRPRLTCGARYR